MTDTELDALAAAANTATPGPWVDEGTTVFQPGGDGYVVSDRGLAANNAVFIAAANPAVVLKLVAEIRQLRADGMQCANGEHGRSCGHDRSEHRDGRCQVGVEVEMGWATCGCTHFVPEMSMADIRAHVAENKGGSCDCDACTAARRF